MDLESQYNGSDIDTCIRTESPTVNLGTVRIKKKIMEHKNKKRYYYCSIVLIEGIKCNAICMHLSWYGVCYEGLDGGLVFTIH